MLARLSGALLVAAFAALVVANGAWAQGYVGLAVGQAKYKDACLYVASSISCTSSDTSLRIFGGYQLNPYFAVEVGGNSLGTVAASTGESADLEAIDLSAVVSWPLANRLAVHGRLGIYQGDFSAGGDTSVPVIAAPPPPPPPPPRVGWSSGSSTGLTYGLGVSYEMTPHAALRLDWQYFNQFGGSDPYGSNGLTISVNVFSIGALVRF